MADIATLGLTVDSAGLRVATDQLDALVTTAGKAEKATGATARALDTLNGKARLAGGATSKAADGTAGLTGTQKSMSKLLADTQFQLDQLGRSTTDQAVAKAAHDNNLPLDLASDNLQLVRTTEELKYARELAGDFTTVLVNGLRGGESLWKSFGNAAIGVLNKISDRLLNDVLNNLFGAAVGKGGLLSGLLGGLTGSGQFALAKSGKVFGLFASGGYTGFGGVGDPAGIVHRGEIVWSQQDIARAGGVAAVENLRLGREGIRNAPPAPVRPAVNGNTSVVVGGAQIVVQGNADGKTLAEMRKMLDERDRQISKTTGKTIDARNRTSQIRKTRA